MQSRRQEELTTQPSSVKLRSHRIEMDPYSTYHHEPQDERSPRSHHRSLSPRRIVEGPRRVLGGDPGSSSVERRDYGWHLDRHRSDWVRSRSPPIGQVRERPFDDEWIMHGNRSSPPLEIRRRNDLPEPMDIGAAANTTCGYDYSISRIGKEKDLSGSRLSVPEEHGLSGKISMAKSMAVEEGTVRGSIRLHPDFVPSSNYSEIGRNLLSSSRDLGMGRFRDESVRYGNPLEVDKLSVMEFFKEGEKPMFYLTHPVIPASQAKDFTSASQFKDFKSTSSRILRGELQGSYREHMLLPSDEFSTGKLKETSGFSGYDQRSLLDSTRDPEAGQNDLSSYSKLYPKLGDRVSDDFGYPSDESYQKMLSRPRLDYDHRDLVRPGTIYHFAENIDDSRVSRRNLRKSCLLDHTRVQEDTVTNNLDMSRVPHASRQGEEYLDFGSTYAELGRKLSRDHAISDFCTLRDQETSHLRLEHDFGRDAGPGLQKGRLKGSPTSQYDPGMHGFAGTYRISGEELGIYDSSDRVFRRKYTMDEEISRHNIKSIISGKQKTPIGIQIPNDRGEEWIGEDVSDLFSSERVAFDHHHYRKAERIFDVNNPHRHSAPDDWLSYQDPREHVHVRANKPGSRYIKGHTRPGSLSWYNSYHLDRRSIPHKYHNVWKRSKDDHHVDVDEQDVDPSEEWVISAQSDPPEESEEFKQLVHEFFLKFSKKLNENPAVRRRYREQGKAGSLFCIVCGRSLSKDFRDTQRLVTHAFMSHKAGLRARHLGLHRAICVLMGWNSDVSPDIITWVPQVMPSANALAQKEDLILWPPLIVVHNSSTSSNNNPEDRKVITIEVLEAFLRGKGFSGGRIRVCLGNSANHSVMVVKFLGTFSGLQDAERLHNLFAENKHGRADFSKVTLNSGKSCINQGDSMEDNVLYGYMGIAEDLDEVDFDTKRRCSIRSKKEIQDLADAPVKPE